MRLIPARTYVMNHADSLYGQVKNRVLTISGNNPSIRVDGGCLIVSDGPTPVPANHRGRAPPVNDRMLTHRFRRAGCTIDRIVVTRPDGFITFAAIKWLHGAGASLVQLDWDGTVLLATAPEGPDRPALRRAQALAPGNGTGLAITREILHVKLKGQAEVSRLLGSDETATLIDQIVTALSETRNSGQILAAEGAAAAAYWTLWQPLWLRFARRHQVPGHWQTFGSRTSPLSGRQSKAASPGNALLNYLYGVLAGEMTIALTAAGLDPGIGIFHADKDRRASLAYDAMEAARPYVDGWLAAWLSTARFSKRDFYEDGDGTIRLTRPLTSHLAMTAPIWRPAVHAIAGWLARALAGSLDAERRLPSPFPALPAPRRTWQGLETPVAKTCFECGKALAPRQRKFCSEACTVSFHLASTRPDRADRMLATANARAGRAGQRPSPPRITLRRQTTS